MTKRKQEHLSWYKLSYCYRGFRACGLVLALVLAELRYFYRGFRTRALACYVSPESKHVAQLDRNNDKDNSGAHNI